MKKLLMILSVVLPWLVRRRLLEKFWGYQLHPTSRIGLAWIFPKQLIMAEHTAIGHLTVCKNIDLLHLKCHAVIGRGNWITGFSSEPSVHFMHQKDRHPQLILEEHAAITHRHIIDCTHTVTLGAFSVFAGYQSQILSHSIDLDRCRQSSAPISIGKYCFLGTNCVLLGGSILPDYSVLGAKSLLNKSYQDTHYLYAGVPARPVKPLPELLYFSRKTGFVQ